ncbi:MAG: L-seryl-tRNA(Sec) selenium transferase [Planctomycetota bacterium]
MDHTQQTALRSLPSAHALAEAAQAMCPSFAWPEFVDAARGILDDARTRIRAGGGAEPTLDGLAARVVDRLVSSSLVEASDLINATGVLLHTGLGRARLSESAALAAARAARGHTPLEIDLERGERGGRAAAVERMLAIATGAESALVVNNNAAALTLILTAHADGREVVVSRGEMIEIGGSFRLPEIIEAGGAVLREVGTTNKTRLDDYRRVINERTAVLLKVHPSNYRVEGFSAEAEIDELVSLGDASGMLIVHDIGSGLLEPMGICPSEPDAKTSVDAGAGLVFFSGDKLLGAPQAGLIVGRRAWVDPLRTHPMMRSFRVDKIRLAALEAVLREHLRGERPPVIALAHTDAEEPRRRAGVIVAELGDDARAVETEAWLGGGSNPSAALASAGVSITPRDGDEEGGARRLRMGRPGVVARVRRGEIVADLMGIPPERDPEFVTAVRRCVLS